MVRVIPKWQRCICGAFSALGILSILIQLIQMISSGHLLSYFGLVGMVIGSYGCYLLGYAALFGTGPKSKENR